MLKLTDRIKEVSKNLQTISPVDADNLIKTIDELKLQKIDVVQIKKQAEENKIKINELETIIKEYEVKYRYNKELFAECLEIYEEKKQEIEIYQDRIEKYLTMYEKIKELCKEII